ncbi:hypothetical protein MTP99_005542 [Tenebrio molitor]|nr:hypothetical protein MTP99_005542 [Tenebrio molitor]
MELNKLNTEGHLGKEGGSGAVPNLSNHPLLAGTAWSMSTPGKLGCLQGKSITLNQARDMGMQACIERMLNSHRTIEEVAGRSARVRRDEGYRFAHFRHCRIEEAEKVRASQEKALKALQDYTLSHYPDSPAKFGELLLRIPELQRTCQVGGCGVCCGGDPRPNFTEDFETDFTQKICVCFSFCFRRQLRVVNSRFFQ